MKVYQTRPGPGEYVEYYQKYIDLVPDGDIIALLEREHERTKALLESIPEDRDHAYAPGKWTIKEVVGHIADTERIFCYRALRYARADTTPLPGFDENTYVPAGAFVNRTLRSLIDELTDVRRATIALFNGLPSEAWERSGVANNNPVSVRALAWIAAGHGIHHRKLLQERYL
jgi:uncharacterized damage-inducible protein DinB